MEEGRQQSLVLIKNAFCYPSEQSTAYLGSGRKRDCQICLRCLTFLGFKSALQPVELFNF